MKKLLRTALIPLLGGVALNAQAALVTFEDLDAMPAGTVVTNQYASDGVLFSGILGGPFLGKVGEPTEGWKYDATNTGDVFAPGEGLLNGNNFITDVVGVDNGGTAMLQVDFTDPAAMFSFDLIDIDGSETYRIDIYSIANALLDTILVEDGDPGTGDGVVTRIGYDLASGIREIAKVVITGSTSTGTKFGLGFDNFMFNTTTCLCCTVDHIPAPAPILLMGLGAVAFGAMRHRKTN